MYLTLKYIKFRRKIFKIDHLELNLFYEKNGNTVNVERNEFRKVKNLFFSKMYC